MERFLLGVVNIVGCFIFGCVEKLLNVGVWRVVLGSVLFGVVMLLLNVLYVWFWGNSVGEFLVGSVGVLIWFGVIGVKWVVVFVGIVVLVFGNVWFWVLVGGVGSDVGCDNWICWVVYGWLNMDSLIVSVNRIVICENIC